MGLKLFKVTFETEMMVLAKDAEDAELGVVDQDFDWSQEIGNGSASAQEVKNVSEIPEDWLGALPYSKGRGAYPERTCQRILELLGQEKDVSK